MAATRITADTLPHACTVVKWGSPLEELQGIARLAARDKQRGFCCASDMRLAVPSINWGMQLQRVCEAQKISALFCAPYAPLTAEDRKRVAKLSALANPHDPKAQRACIEAGMHQEELDALLAKFAKARARTLIKAVGLKESMSLRHAVLHVRGDEDAKELYELMRTQRSRPTFPSEADTIPIVLMNHIRDRVKRVLAVGCVEGLVPSYARMDTEEKRQSALEAGRAVFSSCISKAQDSAVISYFTRIEERVAQAAGISFVRTKQQDDMRVAMTKPTPYLTEWGSCLPATVGGQALLAKERIEPT